MKFSNGLDDLWLRVWANRHIGVTVPHPPATPELNWVLWPRPKMADASVPQIPDGLPGRWVPANGASSHVATFLGDVTVLRLARTEFGRTGLAREAAILRHGTALMPRLVAEGENWLVTERLAGVRPSKPGAWVESLALFVRTFLDPLPASLAGSLSGREPLDVAPLVAVAGVDVVDAIQSSACPGEATRPTHGDLHAGNVLVNAAGELVGVLDFETVALAPPECDVAKWLTVLSAQSGIDAVRTATRLAYPLGIDCRVLHDELLRELVIAASTALSREEPAPYCATVRFLAESLAEDEALPARLLGQ